MLEEQPNLLEIKASSVNPGQQIFSERILWNVYIAQVTEMKNCEFNQLAAF